MGVNKDKPETCQNLPIPHHLGIPTHGLAVSGRLNHAARRRVYEDLPSRKRYDLGRFPVMCPPLAAWRFGLEGPQEFSELLNPSDG